MSKNAIDVSIAFSFKGENYTPRATIDLDRNMETLGEMPDCHRILATLNGIDPYSYLYEVMEVHPPVFDNPTGLAVDYLEGGVFDFQSFAIRWQEEKELGALQEIARRHLGEQDLDQQPGLKAALLEAYRLGRGS